MQVQAKKKQRGGTRRPRKSVIRDGIHPQQLRELNHVFACEDCSYYMPDSDGCNIGYNPKLHKREAQLKSYELNGKMAICRFLEID